MNAGPPIDPDGVEPGKRLVGAGQSVSLAERIARRLRMLSWASPVHAFRLKGRHPLKLLAVPDDPIAGDGRVGRALLDGQFAFRGEKLPLAELDLARLDVSPGFAAWLHGFDWLRDLATAGSRPQAAPIAEQVMRAWLEAHGEQVGEPAWAAELWGRRILFWTAHAPLILSSPDLIYRSAVLNALARGARHLERSADKAQPGQPRIAAWTGATAAALLLPGATSGQAAAEAGLERALKTSMSSDGGVVGRSPAAQYDVVMLLTMLAAVYRARRLPADSIEAALARATPALLSVTHGDGGLASFQGGAPLDGARVGALIDVAGARGRPLRQARDWGYQRLAAADTVVIVDAAPPPLGGVGGCASTLAFEMSDGPHRIVVSCGGGAMTGGHIPVRLADGLRSTAAHSTLVIADSNSTALHGDGALGRGVSGVEMRRQETEAGSRLEASHDGYAKRLGFLHDRSLVLAADGRTLTGEDRVLAAPRRRAPEPRAFAVRFHLAPGIDASLTADGRGALLRVIDGPAWRFRADGGALAIEESLWVDAEARPRLAWQLVVSDETSVAGSRIGWTLTRAM